MIGYSVRYYGPLVVNLSCCPSFPECVCVNVYAPERKEEKETERKSKKDNEDMQNALGNMKMVESV